MSCFTYGKNINHQKRIGVWLRVRSNIDVMKKIKKTKNKRFFDTIERIVVSEYDKNKNIIWLEIWCKNIIDSIRRKDRYNVFYVISEPNENWACEGDLGRGLEN